ncbi:hypothetical protein OCU04_011895 [Sclerotinia nivalis]|uniref:Ankyrin repeat protein n=1 Tax=Sclerotinia nivalis TaxID=352851 RepID=A0A9X0DDL5_9HELO|nr:hypothetical protein OCU04_011895 [Sclerotinia nivalis]
MPDSKLPGIAPLFIPLEMKYNPDHTVLAPIYQAIHSVRMRSKDRRTEDEQTAFEIEVFRAIEERLKWGPNDDREPNSCDQRRLQFREIATNEDNETRLDIQTTLSVAIVADYATIVRDLLEHRNADADLDNKYLGRPLHLAVSYGRMQIIEILLEFGADLSSIRSYRLNRPKRFSMHLQKFACTFRKSFTNSCIEWPS